MSRKEALRLLRDADLLALGEMSDRFRKGLHPSGVVTFVVDRNINYTNVCLNRCRFCAFYRDPGSPEAYLLTKDELSKKIEETLEQGGTQILLQGGLHPELEIDYYVDLLRFIKGRYRVNVHGFSPPEISHLASMHNLTVRETLEILKESGLDSIPGGGAEILSDRVREVLSPKKIKTREWLKVMEEAHLLGMRTTATMMFGSVEGPEDIVEHLDHLRTLQDKTGGFTAFIPWSFQPGNTEIALEVGSQKSEVRSQKTNPPLPPFTKGGRGGINPATAVEYLRVLALSRLYLDNITNIQASWVTQGLKMAQVALRFGANDFGSTMLEENVVASTGVRYCVSKSDIVTAIKTAGFKPAQRDTYYNILREF